MLGAGADGVLPVAAAQDAGRSSAKAGRALQLAAAIALVRGEPGGHGGGGEGEGVAILVGGGDGVGELMLLTRSRVA